MKSIKVTRRTALKSFGLGAPLLAASGLHAAKPIPSANPGWCYRHTVGKLAVFVLSDGKLQFPPHPTFGGDMATDAQVKQVLHDHYRSTDMVDAQLNLCLIDDGKTRTLIDTGYGERGREGTGHLLASLKLAGYAAADIDRVLLTHAHPDHLFGLTRVDGSPVFGNARVLIHANEKRFWSRSEEQLASMEADGNAQAGMLRTMNSIFNDLGDQLETNAAGQRLDASLRMVDLPGHTPGHQGVMIDSDGDQLMVLGDTANNEILMTAQPDWPFGFDNDPAQTAETRRKIFGKVADQRIRVLGYHWSVPGLAHIGRSGNAFRWYPSPMQI